MRLLQITTDYPEFLDWLYRRHRGLRKASYSEQSRARADSLFSGTDFYPSSLRTLGHEAWIAHANNECMQKAWVREHGLKIPTEWRWKFRLRRGIVPWLSRVDESWFYGILAAQIEYYKPDVLLNQAMHLSPRFFREMKSHVRLLVGSHGSPLPKDRDFGAYDLVLSVVDNLVDYFRGQGLKSERLRLAFEPAVLARVGVRERSIPASFIGNLFPAHASRRRWLEYVCERVDVEVWTGSAEESAASSALNRCFRGPAWGVEMFEVLAKSRITLNHHIDVAEAYAGNARLFEATGMGSLLVTDWKRNLGEMFEPGREVVAYRRPEECVEMIHYYLDHDAECQAIAQAGQRRTLRDHTSVRRMEQLIDILGHYL